MSQPARELPAYRDHSVRWDGKQWDRIERAAELLNEREHLDLTPTAIIRAAVKRYLEEVLGQAVPNQDHQQGLHERPTKNGQQDASEREPPV